MECPKCGKKAIVAYKQEYRQLQGEPITEVRAYVCTDFNCMETFAYRNTYIGPRERLDAERFLRKYNEQKEKANQEDLFNDD